jgi:hypothetical protein
VYQSDDNELVVSEFKKKTATIQRITYLGVFELTYDMRATPTSEPTSALEVIC